MVVEHRRSTSNANVQFLNMWEGYEQCNLEKNKSFSQSSFFAEARLLLNSTRADEPVRILQVARFLTKNAGKKIGM